MKYFFLLLRFLFGLGLWCLMSLLVRPKIKFYLFGIAARPTEKLAAQIILFAFQTNLLLLKNRNRAGISIVSAEFVPGFIYFKSRS
jgi:hypothetical protein